MENGPQLKSQGIWSGGKRGGEEEEAERERKTKKRERTDFTLQHTVSLQTKQSLKFLLHPTNCVSCTCLPGASPSWMQPTAPGALLTASAKRPCHYSRISDQPWPSTRHLALGSSQHARLPHPLCKEPACPAHTCRPWRLPRRRRAGGCRCLMTSLYIPSTQYVPEADRWVFVHGLLSPTVLRKSQRCPGP